MTCPTCNGTGKCPRCHGTGEMAKNPAPTHEVTRHFATGALNPDGTEPRVTSVGVKMTQSAPVGLTDFVPCTLCHGSGTCPDCGNVGD